MFEAPFLQSYVAPICRFTEGGSIHLIERLHGTGFLVSNNGIFLTARHVLDKAKLDVDKNGGRIGIFPMQSVGGKIGSLTVPIDRHEAAPDPFDIAIFCTPYRAKTFLRLQNRDVNVWQDVAVMGYPASVANKTSDQYEVQQRAHKGYIQRVIPAGRLQPGDHPPCFELSFAITNGLSGSPLFIHQGNNDILIGVCVGSHESRIVQYENVTVKDGLENFREAVARVEEFGIAHDVRPLLDWRPECLEGKSLGELGIDN